MTENEAWGQAFENGRKVGDAEGYARGKAEAMKHGRWIPVDDEGNPCDEWDCSVCEKRLTFGEEMSADEVYELNCYCPNCGARMERDGDG